MRSILAGLPEAKLTRGFQVSDDNPLQGVAGRADLLRRLGRTVMAAPEIFGRNDTPRPGGLFDHLAALAQNKRIAAPVDPVGGAQASRADLAVAADARRRRARRLLEASVADDRTTRPTGLVPLHKLSQWLSYSLIEPLQWAGIEVTDIDGLTGLAEYRNGGLFIDTGVLTLRDPGAAQREHTVDSELVVEWRALTVALLDRLADVVRARLNMDRESAAARANPAGRHLDRRTQHRQAAARGRRAAAEDHQRRHGVLNRGRPCKA